MSEHRIRHYVYAGGELIPRTASMRGAWPSEAKCSCGWETHTGGAVRSYIDKLVDEHKDDVRLELPARSRSHDYETTNVEAAARFERDRCE